MDWAWGGLDEVWEKHVKSSLRRHYKEVIPGCLYLYCSLYVY